ncbi:MAG TPA: very short patch repair endonuclease [Acidimicrobiales bacterium]|nr:very short patch repair endonuclease [Acidimicrobiales bacterium]
MTARRARRTSPRPTLSKSEQMARVRSAETGPELSLRRAIWAMGGRYRLRPRLPGSPDLVFTSARLAVFVDGCFWHGCPEHYRAPKANADFWRAKVERNVSRDRRVDGELSASGWRVLRVWEHEIRADVPNVAARVLAASRALG